MKLASRIGVLTTLIGALVACAAPAVEVTRSQPLTIASGEDFLNPNLSGDRMLAYLTGYSFWDNTPPGSAAIARPVIHRQAGGIGTYADPITLAVGHRIVGSVQTLDFPAGTRFYFPELRRYAIVEDVCGDGPTPQNGPCHIGYNGLPWLDIYVGGETVEASVSHACMYSITRVHQVIRDPSPGYPVIAGPLTETGCAV